MGVRLKHQGAAPPQHPSGLGRRTPLEEKHLTPSYLRLCPPC